jgi:hypothetical protein
MAHLEQYLVETPAGEQFKVFAANAYDAGKQVLAKIAFKNSLVASNSLVYHPDMIRQKVAE